MSFAYTGYKEDLAAGEADWNGQDVRALLVMTNTTADTDQDAQALSGIGTLDEYDGSGYVRPALASEAVVRDDANNRAEMTSTSPISFGSTVAAGTRSAAGMVIYRHVDGTAANDIPWFYIDSGGFPVAGGGGAFQAAMNAEGWGQIT